MNHSRLPRIFFMTLFAVTALAIGTEYALSSAPPDKTTSFDLAPVVPVASQPPASLIVDAPLPERLAKGYVVIRYRAENLRFLPVYGPAAATILPRIGHLHITVDDAPWHWLDASGQPISITGLPPGPHKVLLELQSANHQLLDSKTVSFDIPKPVATP